MISRNLIVAAAAVCLLVSGWTSASAAKKPAARPVIKVTPKTVPAPKLLTVAEKEEAARFEAMNLAARLARYGRATKNPVSMVAAADIYARIPTREPNDASVEMMPGAREAQKLLDDAIKLAPEDPAVLEPARLVEERLNSPTRAPVGWRLPVFARSSVVAKGRWSTQVLFAGKKTAKVSVLMDADNQVTVAVYDSSNRVVWHKEDAAEDGYAYAQFVPQRNEQFTIWIVNHGQTPAKFSMTAY